MSKILTTIVLAALCVALILGSVLPLGTEIKAAAQKAFNSVKNMSQNITESP